MDNLSVLTQQLILAQNASKLNYSAGVHQIPTELGIFDLALRQRLMPGLAHVPYMATMTQSPFIGTHGVLPVQQQIQLPHVHAALKQGSLPTMAPVIRLTKTCSDTSCDSVHTQQHTAKPEELKKETQLPKQTIKSLNSASKKIQKVKKEEDRESVETHETGKHSPAGNEEKKKKNRRPADQIQRLFKCPSEYCGKSYGSETSLKVHIKNKHTLTISQERLCEIENLLSKISKRDKTQ